MRIDVNQQPCKLWPRAGRPPTRIAKEKSLLRREAVDREARLAFHRFLECGISNYQSAKIGNRFTNHQLAIFVQSLFHFETAELIDDTLRPLLKCLEVRVGPPVGKIAGRIKLPALIVKTMRHLVTDDCTHAAIVERVVG